MAELSQNPNQNNDLDFLDQPSPSVVQAQTGTPQSATNLVNRLAELDSLEEVGSLTKEYLNLEVGEIRRYIYLGIDTMQKNENGKLINLKCVQLVQSNGQRFLGAQISLIRELEQLPVNSPVQITRMPDEKTASGNVVYIYSISLLGKRS